MTQPTYLPNEVIGAVAERVGQQYGIYSSEGPANLKKLCAELNVKTVFLEDDTGDEASDVDRTGRLTIYLPRFTSARRDRFTTAHELGHYFLHHLYPAVKEPQRFGRGARNSAETEANVFAASLLMPRVDFESKFHQAEGDYWSLANEFSVSPAAAEVRAKVLGLVG